MFCMVDAGGPRHGPNFNQTRLHDLMHCPVSHAGRYQHDCERQSLFPTHGNLNDRAIIVGQQKRSVRFN